MIKKLVLTNWRSHHNSELVFENGTNVLVGSMGSGKSLPYFEPILVKHHGQWIKKPIGQIVEDALTSCRQLQKTASNTTYTTQNPLKIAVQTLNPHTLKIEERPISSFIKHDAPARLLKLTTRQGKTLTITPDHSMLALHCEKLEPVRGCDLTIGMHIPCPARLQITTHQTELSLSKVLPEFRSTTNIIRGLELMQNGLSASKAAVMVNVTKDTLSNWRTRKITHTKHQLIAKNLSHAIPESIPLSNPFARICGAYVSEGMCNYDLQKHQYVLLITNTDTLFLRQFEQDWQTLFPNIPIGHTKNDLRINGKIVSALFSRLFGRHAGDKKLPDFILNLPDEQLSQFLQIYFEGDGYIAAHKAELSCSSKSAGLLDGIQTALCRFGIMARIRSVKRPQGKYFELHVLPKHIPRFAQRISFFSERKQNRLQVWSKKLQNRKRYDDVDTIPSIEPLLKKLTDEYHLAKRDDSHMRQLSRELHTYRTREQIGREKLRTTLEKIFKTYQKKTPAFESLQKIAESDLFFDELTDIETIASPSPYVYDISVQGTENFVAGYGNILTHNSSVMDAICFGLFGTFPALSSRRVTLDETIMQKPTRQDHARVAVTFVVSKNEYTVIREIFSGDKTNHARLEQHSQLIAGPKPTEVTARIEQLLNINYDLFTRAVYSEQNGIDYFLRLSPRERKDKFDELLQINRYETARKNAVALANRVKKDATDKKRFAQEQRQRFGTTRIAELTQHIAQKETQQQQLAEENTQLSDRITAGRQQLLELETQAKQHLLLREQHAVLENKLRMLSGQIKADEQNAVHTIETINAQTRQLQTSQQENEQALQTIRQNIRQLREQLMNITQQQGQLQANRQTHTASLSKINRLSGNCPVCQKPLSEHDKHELAKEFEKALLALSQTEKALREQQQDITARLTALETDQSKLEQTITQVRTRQMELHHLFESVQKRDELTAAVVLAKRQLEECAQALLAHPLDEHRLTDARNAQATLENRRQTIAREQQLGRELLTEMKRQQSELELIQQQIKQLEAQSQQLETLGEKLVLFTNCLSATQGQLREYLLDAINEAMHDIWKRVYPYSDYQTAQMVISDGSYELMVKTAQGEWMRVEGMLSGGERSAAALCIRLSFALVLTQNLGWLILDEPTHNLDKRGVSELGQLFRGHLNELIEQVFVITHDAELEKAATGTLYRIHRDKTNDGVSLPQAISILPAD